MPINIDMLAVVVGCRELRVPYFNVLIGILRDLGLTCSGGLTQDLGEAPPWFFRHCKREYRIVKS